MRRVTLRHQQFTNPELYVHFYEGLTIARDGVIDDTLTDVQIESAWRRGYNRTLDGRILQDSVQLFTEIDRQNS